MGPEIDSGFVFEFLCADVRSKLLLARCVRIRSMWMARSCLMPGDDLRVLFGEKRVSPCMVGGTWSCCCGYAQCRVVSGFVLFYNMMVTALQLCWLEADGIMLPRR